MNSRSYHRLLPNATIDNSFHIKKLKFYNSKNKVKIKRLSKLIKLECWPFKKELKNQLKVGLPDEDRVALLTKEVSQLKCHSHFVGKKIRIKMRKKNKNKNKTRERLPLIEKIKSTDKILCEDQLWKKMLKVI